jgi:hypothetical protein
MTRPVRALVRELRDYHEVAGERGMVPIPAELVRELVEKLKERGD